ncbi:hypothetical protein GW17_00057132 [Ensete ventricosum]|nr:hypothetical protein GW17_00057132 [Ensete ventricosum]
MEEVAEEVSVHIDDMVSTEEEEEREDGGGVEEAQQQTVTKNLNGMDSLEMEAGKISVMHGASKVLSTAAVMQLAFQSIGVVYGDIGTSPLYVFASTFSGRVPSKHDIVGALSLIIYSLTLLPLIKYVFIVLRANDNGEGGGFACLNLWIQR